eukprot:GFUD01043966.1.p1 GENE.GFUD01043966.1~~GFUD01043966.1.p1  ORF type:complete len:1978 (-),score=498.59 GFUD01043966.1:399-6332(-)
MSIVSGFGQAGENESGMQENQFAVWIRNVPTWLDEERFYDEISSWFEVDKDKSHCFKNKQDSSWIGIRYGWAIVTFKSKRSRNKFLEDEDRHFVRETDDAPYEKLKVSPWYDKQKVKPTFNKPEKSFKIPLYKIDLEKEFDPSNLSIEDFSRNCTDTSIQSYKGKVHSFITNLAGQGHVGNIEINVFVKNNFQSELVVFHSDSVWMCFKHSNCTGTPDCAVKCGTDNFLPNRLKIGSEVNFNARKIPHGMVEGRRYQAKAIWLGQDTQPNFITPPAAKKLDEYLEDFINESGKGVSKDPSPEFESPRARSIETTVSTTTDSGTSSPLPGITIANRPKPLKGGLNQLNSTQDKHKSITALKKPQPTNFAQAVAAAPTLIRDEHSNLVLAVGFVESVISEVEAIISVPEHGTFNLHIKHLDLGYKPTQGINKYLTAKLSTVSVTLKQGKALPGSKPKYEIVRAHLNDEKKKLEDKFDPFVNEFKPRQKINQPIAPDTWEELVDDPNDKQKNGHEQQNGDFEIDLDELDEYYDDLQGIIEYLEKELPKVIPKIANDEKCFQTLANRILSNTRSANDEAKELQIFLDQYSISSRIKSIFISEYIKFRSNLDEVGQATKAENAVNVISAEKVEENEFIAAIKKTESRQETIVLPKDYERKKRVSLDTETQEHIISFLNWLKTAVKNKDILAQKVDLYSNILQNNPTVAEIWLEIIQETQNPNFLSFVNKTKLGEDVLAELKVGVTNLSFGSGKGIHDWATVVTWFEGDTNHYRLEPKEAANEGINGSTPAVESSFQLSKNSDLTNFEKEFVKHQDKAKETSVFIRRAIVFLKKSEIKFEGLHKLHLRHVEESSKPRNREFNHKIQNILNKRSNQKILDDTNTFIQKSGGLKMKEHTPISYRRLDKFIPILSQSLCGFFSDRHEMRNGKHSNGEREKTNRKQEGDETDEREKPTSNGDTAEMSASQVEGDQVVSNRKRQHEVAVKSDTFSDADYVSFTHFLELAIASGRITLAPTATVEGILWTFQARNISHSKLESIYTKSQEQGGCSWQLQISQLKLNPPLGVTVPEIAEYLSAYFGSVKNTPNVLLSDDEDVVLENEEIIEVQDESELMEMIQNNLYDQYQESELTTCAKRLKKSSIKIRENDLINSFEELYSSHYLFNSSAWPHNEDLCDFSSLCALLSAGIWHDLNVTSDFLAMCVRSIHEHDTPYQNVLVKWAKLLETSTIFTASVMDIFTIIKATMISYDENVPEEDLVNISTNYCLYNVEGFVSKHLSPHFFAVQTRFSLVVCHLGTAYSQCSKNSSFMLPSDHWQSCSLDSCLPVGSRVLLHSTGIKDPKGKIICQIADIIWTPVDDKFDPPETGIILPGNAHYKKYVQYFAEKHVAKITPELFGDTNYASNCHRYLALEEQNSRPVFCMEETWPQNTLEMQKMFVFSEMGGMARPLLRSNWAAVLNTSDQEKERLLNETFSFFQSDTETVEMIEFISPYVERAGLRNAMKVLNQKYPGKNEEQENLNDTDSEKRQNLAVEEGESSEEVEISEDTASKEVVASAPVVVRPGVGTGRNRQLSTDTIKDETLWMAENNLMQLWDDESEQMKIDKMVDLEEEEDVDDADDDSEEYVVDDDNPEKDANQLGAIGSSKPKPKEAPTRQSTSPIAEVDQVSAEPTTAIDNKPLEIRSSTPGKPSTASEENSVLQLARAEDLERVNKFEEAVCNLSAWQPMASDIISGNRDLIMQLNNRIEFLESALNQLTLSLATSGGGCQGVKEQEKEPTEPKKGGRTYVKIAKEGDEEDIAEVPTNSEGLLPQMTVKALYEGTSAIKFRVSASSKTWRALLMEDDLFHPPEDGWGDRIYTCTQPQGCIWMKNDSAPSPISAPTPGLSLASGTSSLDHSLTSPLTYSMGTLGQTNNIVSPFLGLPPMAHIWGNGGLSVTSQVSPGIGQSMFGNMQSTLGNMTSNMGALNNLGTSGNPFKAYPATTFGKK